MIWAAVNTTNRSACYRDDSEVIFKIVRKISWKIMGVQTGQHSNLNLKIFKNFCHQFLRTVSQILTKMQFREVSYSELESVLALEQESFPICEAATMESLQYRFKHAKNYFIVLYSHFLSYSFFSPKGG